METAVLDIDAQRERTGIVRDNLVVQDEWQTR